MNTSLWRSQGAKGRVGAIIVAAGEGRRMGGKDKVFTPLLDKPLILYAVEVFSQSPEVDSIVLVLGERNLEQGQRLIKSQQLAKVVAVTQGGPRRQDSVRRGLAELPPCQWVMIHDGARPCLDSTLITEGLRAAEETGAAAAGVPVKDTIKYVDSSLHVEETPLRERLWAIQTPQVFRREILEEAHVKVSSDLTDDAAMVEQLGYRVKVFRGSYTNLKVTTPEDLWLAEAILRNRGSVTAP